MIRYKSKLLYAILATLIIFLLYSLVTFSNESKGQLAQQGRNYDVFNPETSTSVSTSSVPSKKTVILDAGHGGYDPGAVGAMGTKEKEVVLAITLKVGEILAKNGVETTYTRISDNINWPTNQTANLQVRCDISNNVKPDYFVSIHANSYISPSASGIETYYSSGNTAGQKLAQAVQEELIKETGRIDRKVKTAGFYVLNYTDATAILVETSFLSNPEEEILLGTQGYQDKLAKAIATGILKSLGINSIVY